MFALMVDVVAPVLHANVFEPVPPPGVAVSDAELPAHASLLFTDTVGFGFAVNVPDPDPVQPFVSVTVTEYVPVVLGPIVEVVAPVLQENVAEPVPPLGVAVSAAELPEHASLLFTETVGFGSDVRVPEPDPVQPFVSVTVTEYVPAVLVLIVDVVAPVLHLNVAEPVPPEGVAVNVAGKVFAQTSGLLTVTVGFGFTITTALPEI